MKLVRDSYPGEPARTPVEHQTLLRLKLFEEAAEASRALTKGQLQEELADVLEVVYALADTNSIDRRKLERTRVAKLSDKGGFMDARISNRELQET
jgi:predicted house-cleaning noncanonical NTP pyrophosphatase (MazG superfamily)